MHISQRSCSSEGCSKLDVSGCVKEFPKLLDIVTLTFTEFPQQVYQGMFDGQECCGVIERCTKLALQEQSKVKEFYLRLLDRSVVAFQAFAPMPKR